MTPLERKLIRRLVYAPHTLSRNRNFHAFDEPWTRAARRTAGLLRSLLEALHSEHTLAELIASEMPSTSGSAESGEQAWEVVITDQRSGMLRRAHLRDAELAILCEDAECARRLGRPLSAVDEPSE